MALKRLCTLGRLRRLAMNVVGCVYLLAVLFALFNRRDRLRYTELEEVFASKQESRLHARTVSNVTNTKPMCQLQWGDLKLQTVDVRMRNKFHMDDVVKQNEAVTHGGEWTPNDCVPYQRVAIVIPYRNRYQHLLVLLNRLHPMLQRQRISYKIYLIEQAGEEDFNRGMLMNIGFQEALKHEKFDCFIFHDVDLVPEHDRNIYLCDDQARHLASAIDESRYHVLYYQYFGGVIALNTENTIKINGYSNVYWGWGQEDDDLSARTTYAPLLLTRPPEHIGRYKMVRHKKSPGSDSGISLFLRWRERWMHDGLNNIDGKYKLLNQKDEKLYTHLTVDLGEAPSLDEMMTITSKYQSESLLWYLWFYFP